MHEKLVEKYVSEAREFMRTDCWPGPRDPMWTELANVIADLANERDKLQSKIDRLTKPQKVKG